MPHSFAFVANEWALRTARVTRRGELGAAPADLQRPTHSQPNANVWGTRPSAAQTGILEMADLDLGVSIPRPLLPLRAPTFQSAQRGAPRDQGQPPRPLRKESADQNPLEKGLAVVFRSLR